MIDALNEFIINQKLLERYIDPLDWNLTTYIINRAIYDGAVAKIEKLGFKGE